MAIKSDEILAEAFSSESHRCPDMIDGKLPEYYDKNCKYGATGSKDACKQCLLEWARKKENEENKKMRFLTGLLLALFWLLFIGLITFLVFDSIRLFVHAQDSEDTALALVQCLRAECETCPNQKERAAIAWVLRKTARARGVYLRDQILDYCAVFKLPTKRSRKIVESTFLHPKRGTRRWWRKTRRWALRFLAGRIPDPEPMAKHWGGDMDTRRMTGRILLRSFCNSSGCTHLWSKKMYTI